MNHLVRLSKELTAIWQHADRRSSAAFTLALFHELPAIVRSRTLTPADEAMGEATTCSFRAGPDRWLDLNGSAFGLAREICCRRVYFALPGFEIGPRDRVVDLGANTGVFTTLAGVLAGRVVSVEAQSRMLPLIEQNVKRNGCSDKVSIEFGLVGAASGLFSDEANRKAASHWGDTPPQISVQELLDRHGLEEVDFLKVDIEGSEFALFATNNQWLGRVKRIVAELHPEFGDVDSLVRTLSESGFDVQLVDSNQRAVRTLGNQTGYLFAKRR